MNNEPIIIDNDYNCSVYDETGQEYRVSGSTLYTNDLVSWEGWKCSAGVNSLYIDPNMTVFSDKCCNDKLGSLIDGFELFTEYSTCKRRVCHPCVLGLSADKYDPLD